jgi:RimJ/RimL family protein N-acetyltransferase
MGITLVARARGKGYGLEAVRLFTEHLLANGWPRVQASTALDNHAMRRVLERAGYGFEGVLRGFAPGDDGAREDYAMYAATGLPPAA